MDDIKLIDKDKIIAELEKRLSLVLDPFNNNIHTNILEETYKSILSFINSLEVKEVDFIKERMKDCPYRVVGCEKYSGTVTECNGACAWMVDYPKLKELKAKKGE